MKSERFDLDVDYYDVVITVKGRYYPYQSSNDYDVPPTEEYVDIEHFFVDTQDIGGLLTDSQVDDIEYLVLEQLR